MKDWQQRVINEKRVIDEDLVKLSAYLDGKVHARFAHVETFKIEPQERLMREQQSVMTQYSAILGARIALFESDSST